MESEVVKINNEGAKYPFFLGYGFKITTFLSTKKIMITSIIRLLQKTGEYRIFKITLTKEKDIDDLDPENVNKTIYEEVATMKNEIKTKMDEKISILQKFDVDEIHSGVVEYFLKSAFDTDISVYGISENEIEEYYPELMDLIY